MPAAAWSAAAAKTLRDGDGAAEGARLDAGDGGHERKGDARAIPGRVGERRAATTARRRVDDDAGLAFAGAEEEAVAARARRDR